jgi:hypothetical protein
VGKMAVFGGQRFVGEPEVEFFLETGLIVFFQLAHFEHELQVDEGAPALDSSPISTAGPRCWTFLMRSAAIARRN